MQQSALGVGKRKPLLPSVCATRITWDCSCSAPRPRVRFLILGAHPAEVQPACAVSLVDPDARACSLSMRLGRSALLSRILIPSTGLGLPSAGTCLQLDAW